MEKAKFTITPEFMIDVLIRRRWIIMVPLSFALITGICLAIVLPKVYEATTMILVEGQSVPQAYVRSVVTEDTAQRINTISQQIQSRTNLEKIISDFGLFVGPEYKDMYIEDKVVELRKRIKVDVVRRGSGTEAFTISFKDKDPEKVMRVANGLASYFIDENIKVRESQALGTSKFLDSELESARSRLEQVEESMKNYRKANMGELPEQLTTNLRILERLQDNLTERQKSLRDAKLRMAELESQTSNRAPSVVVIGGAQTPNGGGTSIEELSSQLEALQSRYTDKHPDIQRLKRQIAELEAKPPGSSTQDSAVGSTQRISPQLRQQLADTDREIKMDEAEIENLKAQVSDYQNRIENIPKREQELLSLKRDYDNIQASYDSLLSRKLEADISVNMERKQKGEQFRILDPARIPQRPVEPNMKKVFLLVVTAGLGVGVGIALMLEFIKPSYRRPDEIEAQYEMPVLVMIPQLLKPKQIWLRKMNVAASIIFSAFVLGLFSLFGIISLKGSEFAVDIFKRLAGS